MNSSNQSVKMVSFNLSSLDEQENALRLSLVIDAWRPADSSGSARYLVWSGLLMIAKQLYCACMKTWFGRKSIRSKKLSLSLEQLPKPDIPPKRWRTQSVEE